MTKHELLSEIFRIVKHEVEIPHDLLYRVIDVADYKIDKARNKLIKEYGLIEVIRQRLSVTNVGENYDSFDDYLKSLNPKPDYIKIASLILTAIFGLIAIYQKYDYHQTKNDLKILKHQYDSVNIQSHLYKDSLFELKSIMKTKTEKPLLDTLQTKN